MCFKASQPAIVSDSVDDKVIFRSIRVFAKIDVPPTVITMPVTERGSPMDSNPSYEA
jgi:hypothetical protein